MSISINIPVQVLHQELQCFVVDWRQLTEQVSDLEEDAVKLHTDLPRLGGQRPARCLHLLHDDALALLGQTDEVIVVAEQDERLRELHGTAQDISLANTLA